MCDCRTVIEDRLTKRFAELKPEASRHKASLNGYAFILSDTVETKGYMPIEYTAAFPLKQGGKKQKTVKENMIFTYCPFCGVKY